MRVDGAIDFERSLGLLTTAPYVEFVMVLPYVAVFYVLLSFLEDVGYIPRLALLLDNIMHRLGLHGFAIIPLLLGFGCNVPGILATRVLESTRERFIAATIISIGVPCAALQAMIIAMLGPFGGRYVAALYLILFLVWLVLGEILNRFLPGYSPELLLEIPPYRLPSTGLFFRKVGRRIRGFIIEAVPIVLASVLVINLLQQLQLLGSLSRIFAPVVRTIFGLPPEAAWPLIIGLVRKDIAAAMLLPLGLTVKQLLIATAVLTMSFPCVATFAVFLKELGGRYLILASLLMLVSALAVGGTLNLLLP
jgi:ferrous iron transport protein B